MDISALATEELLAVFRFLTARELLRCRAVCHRWAWLAQDPVLWSSRCVDADVSKDLESDSHRKFVAAILNFAPCFGELVVDLSSPGADSLWSALISTSCAISKVVCNCSASDAVHAALIISRQVLLGRLKALKLEVDRSDTPEPPGSDRSLMSLLIHITHIQGLEELYFNRDDLVSLPPEEPAKSLGRASAPVSASLKRLTVVNCHSFCELLLQWHADTLEFVRWLSVEPPSALAVHLLCRLPRLRELACAPLEGMRALLQCPSLDRLEIFLNGGPTFAAHLPEACDLVRGLACTRLEQLVLVPTRDMVASASEVLRCLKGSGWSTAVLRSLRLHLECEAPLSGPLYQQPVVELLHRLPLLSLAGRGQHADGLLAADAGWPGGAGTEAALDAAAGQIRPGLRPPVHSLRERADSVAELPAAARRSEGREIRRRLRPRALLQGRVPRRAPRRVVHALRPRRAGALRRASPALLSRLLLR